VHGLSDVEVPPEFEPRPGHFAACWLYRPQARDRDAAATGDPVLHGRSAVP
jgi:hypothetical protein